MIFIASSTEPTMVLMLTEQDMNNMRGGRTIFVDKTATKGHKFDKIVLSLHKNQTEIENALKAAGHGALLKNMPSPVPKVEDAVCDGCQGMMPTTQLLDGNCICCWREKAKAK